MTILGLFWPFWPPPAAPAAPAFPPAAPAFPPAAPALPPAVPGPTSAGTPYDPTGANAVADFVVYIVVNTIPLELVMALIDAVMLAKKCTYAAAQRICHRLLLDHWNFDMEVSGISGQTNLSSQIFHSIRSLLAVLARKPCHRKFRQPNPCI